MHSRHTLLYIIGLAVLLVGCDRQTVFNHFEHTALTGWERNDSLLFDIPPVAKSCDYVEEVGLRVTGAYPFIGISLIIEQTVYPSLVSHRDTLNCTLTDRQGNVTGGGVSQYQYQFPLKLLRLRQGDSLHVALRHDMKREILPGIADVGLILRQHSH